MRPFPDCPFEIIEEIIHALQDDTATLKSFSRTCRSLHPLCRKYTFRTVSLSPLRASITSFGRLLDRKADIAALVQNLEYEIESDDANDGVVLRVLERLHPVQSLQLNGSGLFWDKFLPAFRTALLRLIHSPSLKSLRICRMWNFPVTAFIPSTNLTDLAVIQLRRDTPESYQQACSLGRVPQLHSFSFSRADGAYVKAIVDAERPDGLPIIDFSHLQTLDVQMGFHEDVEAVHILLQATEKLGTLRYQSYYMADGCRGLAASIIKSNVSTLKRLHFVFVIGEYYGDHLCGLCEQLRQLRGLNVIEEITLQVSVTIFIDDGYTTDGVRWRKLDAALANGFPRLRRVSAHIVLKVDAKRKPQFHSSSQEELNKIPEYCPWLSQNPNITFRSSTKRVYEKI